MSKEQASNTSAPVEHKNKVPDWIKPEIFNKALKEVFGNDFQKIKNFKVIPAVQPGENYATFVLRANIDVELKAGVVKSTSFIIKTMQAIDQLEALFKGVFAKESEMYRTVVPEFEQMYREVGKEVTFSARLFELETNEVHLMLENLCDRGFKNTKRQEGLDMEHTKHTLIKLAQWHAASATRIALKGRYPSHLEHGNLQEEMRPIMKQMAELTIPVFQKCLSKYKGHEIFKEAAAKLYSQLVDEMFKQCKLDPNDFNVLNHGDLWSNNVMYRDDAFGKIKDVCFVDFQIPRYGNPAQDLWYFLISSTRYEDKIKHFDYYIKFYHDCLVEHLKLLKYPKDIPSLRQLHILMHKQSLWGFFTATSTMAGVLVEPSKDANIDDVLKNTGAGANFTMLLFSNDNYRKHAELIFPWLLYRGVIEY